jgi:hypothetical protein
VAGGSSVVVVAGRVEVVVVAGRVEVVVAGVATGDAVVGAVGLLDFVDDEQPATRAMNRAMVPASASPRDRRIWPPSRASLAAWYRAPTQRRQAAGCAVAGSTSLFLT